MSKQTKIECSHSSPTARIHYCEWRPTLTLLTPTESYFSQYVVKFVKRREDVYRLVSFMTGFGTIYWQYLHSRLIQDGIDPSSYKERFPKWSLDKRKIDRRLARAIHEHD